VKTKRLGRTELQVPIVGVGTAFLGYTDAVTAHGPIGSAPVDEEYGVQTLTAAVEAGCTLIDTAPLYSDLQAENIVGRLARARPDLIAGSVVTTKAGSLVSGRDYRRDAILRSVEASLLRCGVDRFDVVSIHDAQGVPFEELLAADGALGALRELQGQGVIGAVGTASSDLETNTRLVETGEFDVAIVPGGWSLLSQKIRARILPAAERFDVGLIIATPLERGLLATGPIPGQPHRARHFSDEALDYVRALMAVCDRYGVPLLSASLQWPSRHPQVASCIPGPRTPPEAASNAAAASAELPDEFWAELEPMIRDWDYAKEPA
jgi:D-threo-aldose 1-dehydrogenase